MHALSFRVMRLSKPSLSPSSHLRLDLQQDFTVGPSVTPAEVQLDPENQFIARRVQLGSPTDVCGLEGFMELPQSFGSLYLGETFTCYISVSNPSKAPVTDVACKAELQTDRQKIVLYDNASAAVALLQPGARHDFIIRHDVKEVGAHTLVCSTVYTTPEGERKFLPQYFKFSAANPLSVRTKTRMVHSSILLEACIENQTKGPLVLDYVRFDPSPQLSVETIQAPPEPSTSAPANSGPLDQYIRDLQVISPSGGAVNLLYRLAPKDKSGKGPLETAGSGMGKLEIKWRSSLGDVGRLQTQQILAAAAASKELELQAAQVPDSIAVEQPFTVKLRVCSHVERRVGGLLVMVNQEGKEEGGRSDGVMPLSAASLLVDEIAPYSSAVVEFTFLALRSGVQQLPEVSLVDARAGLPQDTLALSILVQ